MMNKYIPLIVFGVLLNACAQIVLKQGMRVIGPFGFSVENIFPILVRAGMNPFILTGLACYVFSVLVWLMVLSRVEVSFAYPLLSIGYVVTAFAGYLFFNENMGYIRWAGVLIICFGVYLITRTG
jgi:multidrug transporter EmrE-like cation transporter